jgi:hypothetical protein
LEIQRGDEVGDGQGRARMPIAAMMDHGKNIAPQLAGVGGQHRHFRSHKINQRSDMVSNWPGLFKDGGENRRKKTAK